MTTVPTTTPTQAPWWHALMPFSVMDRYIISELIPPFLFGVGIFTSLGVSIDSLFYLVNRVVESGLPVSVAAQVLLLKMPQFVVYSFPVSTLLTTLLTFSRFSSDSELIALRGCGVSVYRMVMPALAFCLLVTGLTFMFNESIVPAANLRASTTLSKALGSDQPNFREQNILYQEFKENVLPNGEKQKALERLFYAREFDGRQMKGLTILDFSKEGLEQIVSAGSAAWNAEQKTWDFYNGTIYVVAADGSYRNIVKFDQQQIKLPRTPLDLAQSARDYGEMNIAESREYLSLIEQTADEGKIRELKVRINQKYALPFVCVAYGLVGAALGAQLRRTGRAAGFAISIVIVFTYYLMAFMFGAIAQSGSMSPILGAWIPNIFGLTAGLFLLMRASK